MPFDLDPSAGARAVTDERSFRAEPNKRFDIRRCRHSGWAEQNIALLKQQMALEPFQVLNILGSQKHVQLPGDKGSGVCGGQARENRGLHRDFVKEPCQPAR